MDGMDEPSKVLHVRFLAAGTEANDIRQTLSPFGQVTYIVMITKHNQALVEMQNDAQASSVLQYCRNSPLVIRGREVEFRFSKSQEIKRATPAAAPPNSPGQVHQGEHMLLMTILNPLYPIDVDVLHSILHPYGQVLRIVIFHKNGTQALIEFDNPTSAANAKQMLDGKDIYDGCCTLRISFSRAEKLNVRCNNDKTRDFTNPTLPTHLPHEAPFTTSGGPLVPTPAYQPVYSAPNAFNQPMGQTMGVLPGGVLMVHNLPTDNLSCDHVFNLFCIYGNVAKVKLLANKEGAAMVQMFDKQAAERACQNLNKLNLAGNELSVTFSKHPFLTDGRASGAEEDAQQTSRDYTTSQCNRFTKQQTQYRHFYGPTSVLYFSNAPPETSEQSLIDHFSNLGLPSPTKVKLFSSTSTPKPTGLLEFANLHDAAMAVFMGNNTRLNKHTLKLAFSSNNKQE